MMADDIVVDQFSSFDYKEGGDNVAPEFVVDEFDIRRLNFYRRVHALIETVGRHYLTQSPGEGNDAFADRGDAWREFGDPAVLVERVASAVVGSDVQISVDGADDSITDSPAIPPSPKPPAEGLDEPARVFAEMVYEQSIAVWEQNATAVFEKWLEDLDEAPRLQARQDWFHAWAEKEGFLGKIFENEVENVVPYGSGVVAVGWDDARLRPSVRIYDPAVYFPVLEAAEAGAYPRTVHLAWVYPKPVEDGKTEDWVRKITYELIDVLESDGVDVGVSPSYLAEGETWADSCVMTDATMPLKGLDNLNGDSLPKGAEYKTVLIEGQEVELNRYPIGLDFIPLVHIPNTLASGKHFGRSTLARLPQLFDEIAATDADESYASRWAGQPPGAVSALPPGESTLDIVPGKWIRLGDGGRVSVIDMAKNLGEIGERGKRLRKAVSVNASVPEGLLGRIDASEVPSGVALTISFSSFEQKITAMRLARADKYRLLMKMVQRIAVQNQDESLGADTTIYSAEIRFGTFMPQDLAGIANVVKALRDVNLLSQETGVRMAQEAGVPSPDVAEEVSAIRAVDASTADLMTAALEDPKYAAEYLGIDGFAPATGPDSDTSTESPASLGATVLVDEV